MRRALAAVIDVVLVAVLGYLAFRLAVLLAPCKGDMSSCPSLTPLIVLFVVLAVVLYFGLGQLLWKRTPGERAVDLGGE